MNVYKNVKIIDTAFGGFGVAKIENGLTIFIPFTVENDIVDIEITKIKKTFGFGKVINICEKSPLRKDINCPNLYRCGGCDFGHIEYQSQLMIKEKIVKKFFRNFLDFQINKVIPSKPERYRFRAKFRLFKKNFGFFGFRSNEFIPINDCLICKKTITEKIKTLAEMLNSNELTECYIIENDKNEALIKIDKNGKLKKYCLNGLVGLKAGVNFIGRNFIKIDYSGSYYYAGFNTFSQANRFMLKEFAIKAVEEINENDEVLELYSGTGFFTYHISQRAKEVFAIESNNDAVDLLKKLNLKNVSVKIMDVENIKKFEKFKNFSVLFVDPPRQGLSKNIIKMITNLKFKKIIYVSCNPSTQARDLKLIDDFYEIKKFYILDMFPNTHHIETIAILLYKN